MEAVNALLICPYDNATAWKWTSLLKVGELVSCPNERIVICLVMELMELAANTAQHTADSFCIMCLHNIFTVNQCSLEVEVLWITTTDDNSAKT